MGESETGPVGPDLSRGVPADETRDGEMLQGHVGEEAVLLARWNGSWYAIGGSCSHYGVALVEGLLVDGTVRCAAHHAAFDLRTGEPVRAPALRGVGCWEVEVRDGLVFVTRPRETRTTRPVSAAPSGVESVVIVGAGAAGSAAAVELRRQGFAGSVTLLGVESSAPYDRPNVSKDYLAGSAPEEWMPLHADDFYQENEIRLVTGARAAKLDTKQRQVQTLTGEAFSYDRLLLATGADPVRLPLPTHMLRHVHYLRTIDDARRIIKAAESARRVVVVGASFIGLESAAALRARGLEVHVVSHEKAPLVKVLGDELGGFIRGLHEAQGVVFHLEDAVAAISPEQVTLRSGRRLDADLVVVGIGVRPGVGLAAWAKLRLHEGALAVDEFLETSTPGVYAAGDLIAWPDPRSGEMIRSEHWVVAQRQGQTAARNMLGAGERFDAVPFFWSVHYDTTVRYAGHAERWGRIDRTGDPGGDGATYAFRRAVPDGGTRTMAVATVGRDRECLQAEYALERLAWSELDAMVPGGSAG